MTAAAHGQPLAPSAWLQRFAGLLRPGGSVLDVACGSGRNLRWLAAQGFACTGVDRDADAVEPLRAVAEIVVADIEAGPPPTWPFAQRRFDAIVVANYLWRPLWPTLRAALADGGVLLVETFADGQQHIGKPSRPEFLLRPGELLRVCDGLRIVAFEDGFDAAGPRYVQRVVAVNEAVNETVNQTARPALNQPPAAASYTGPPPKYGLAGGAS